MKKTNLKEYLSPIACLCELSSCDVIAVSGLGGEEKIELNEHVIP